MWDLVGNPEDRFSDVAAQLFFVCNSQTCYVSERKNAGKHATTSFHPAISSLHLSSALVVQGYVKDNSIKQCKKKVYINGGCFRLTLLNGLYQFLIEYRPLERVGVILSLKLHSVPCFQYFIPVIRQILRE